MPDAALRAQISAFLAWPDAHARFDEAVKGVPPKLRGVVPDGLPYSLWQLLEHIRFTQADILEFCLSRRYRTKKWPADYWPSAPAPRNGRGMDPGDSRRSCGSHGTATDGARSVD